MMRRVVDVVVHQVADDEERAERLDPRRGHREPEDLVEHDHHDDAARGRHDEARLVARRRRGARRGTGTRGTCRSGSAPGSGTRTGAGSIRSASRRRDRAAPIASTPAGGRPWTAKLRHSRNAATGPQNSSGTIGCTCVSASRKSFRNSLTDCSVRVVLGSSAIRLLQQGNVDFIPRRRRRRTRRAAPVIRRARRRGRGRAAGRASGRRVAVIGEASVVAQPKIQAASELKEVAKVVAASPSNAVGVEHNSQSGNRVFPTPLARRLAKDKGVDLTNILGSGPNGRIVMKDVETARPVQSGSARAAASPGAIGAAAPSEASVLKLFEEGSYDLVPHDGMRKTIARRLTQSKQTVPHFYVTVDISLENLLTLRERLNLQAPKSKEGVPAWKVSVNDFVIKAMAMALMKVPEANVSWTENNMVKHHHADVGVAVSIPGGLITPIVRKAETKGLAQISIEMAIPGRSR